MSADARVRVATVEDAGAIGLLLDAFNREFGEPSPGSEWLAVRLAGLISAGAATVLLAGPGPDGVAVVRFRPAIWSDALECYLAELYVAPAMRRGGLGRALVRAVIELARERGAGHIEIGVDEPDMPARALYEQLGFDNHGGRPDGPVSYFYELEL